MTTPPQPVPPQGPSGNPAQGPSDYPTGYPAQPVPTQYPAPGDPSGAYPAPAEPPASAEPASSGTPYGFDDRGHVRRTKISGVWIGLIAAGIVLILLLIFIAQNLHTVGLHFLGFYGKVSVGLALLVAALCGLLIALVPGTIRILQLRKALRRNAPDAGSRS